MYESRISFIRGLGFAITPGQPEVVPDFATGRPIPEADQVLCFGCHTTASSGNGHFDPSQLMKGVSCEGCHGPGAGHVSLAESGSETPGLIFNPTHLTPSQSVDFCGACHRTWWDVVGKYNDVGAVRFPAYRLEGSRCWGEGMLVLLALPATIHINRWYRILLLTMTSAWRAISLGRKPTIHPPEQQLRDVRSERQPAPPATCPNMKFQECI
jgi:hypothetical protein